MVQLAAGKLPVMLPPKPLFEKGAMTPRFPEKWKADFEKAVTDRDENSLILTMKLRFLSEEANKEIDFAHGLLRAFYEKNMERMKGGKHPHHSFFFWVGGLCCLSSPSVHCRCLCVVAG